VSFRPFQQFTAVVVLLCGNLLLAPGPVFAQELPAGTVVQLRLRQGLSSFGSKPDTPVSAIVIAPIAVGGKTLVPLGTELTGVVEETKRVGLGFSREVARLHITFDMAHLPDGQSLPIVSRITGVDNAREKVDQEGRIRGIRATASFSSVVSGFLVSIGFVFSGRSGFACRQRRPVAASAVHDRFRRRFLERGDEQ